MKSLMGPEIDLLPTGSFAGREVSASTLLFRPKTRANPELRFSFSSPVFSFSFSSALFFRSFEGALITEEEFGSEASLVAAARAAEEVVSDASRGIEDVDARGGAGSDASDWDGAAVSSRWLWLSDRLTLTALRRGYLSTFCSFPSASAAELVLAGALFRGALGDGEGGRAMLTASRSRLLVGSQSAVGNSGR